MAGRCEAFGGTVTSVPEVAVTAAPASQEPVTSPRDGERSTVDIEPEVREFVDQLLPKFPAGDPRRILCSIAVKLARRVDESGAAPAAIQQLRVMLMQIAEAPNGPAGPVDEMRLRHHQRQLDAFLVTSQVS